MLLIEHSFLFQNISESENALKKHRIHGVFWKLSLNSFYAFGQ